MLSMIRSILVQIEHTRTNIEMKESPDELLENYIPSEGPVNENDSNEDVVNIEPVNLDDYSAEKVSSRPASEDSIRKEQILSIR